MVQENLMDYTEKLLHKYKNQLAIAKESGVLKESTDWLESCLILNDFDVKTLLKMIYHFFNTNHLIEGDKEQMTAEDFCRKMCRTTDQKKNTLFIK